MSRVVLHVDMDAFFAAVHERARPELAGAPLVVGADPCGGRGRGVVCTANYAARAYGIRSAMPISEAYRRCPHAVYLPPARGLYRPANDEVMAVLTRYADPLAGGGVAMEVAGLDEAYLDVTRRSGGDFGRARSMALSLQAAVKRETGLSCSVGVAASKSVAKIASDHRKPHGVTVVPPEDAPAFLEDLPVRLINGCGPKTAARLADEDIHTIGALAATPRAFLKARFGSHGLWIHDVAQGIDDRPVRPDRGPSKSRGNEQTYLQDEAQPARVLAQARRLLQGLLDDADRRPFATVSIKLRYADFTTLTRSHTLSIPLDPRLREAGTLAWATTSSLLSPLLDGRPVRLVGVRLSGFAAATGQRALSEFLAPQAASRFQSTATSGSVLP